MFLKSIIKNAIKKVTEVQVIPSIDLPVVEFGRGGKDNCKIYTGLFKSGNSEPYIIYSAGIGDLINFEMELLEFFQREGIKAELFAIDPTPASLDFLARQDLPGNFHVVPYALSDRDGDVFFALPQAEGWVSGASVDVKNDSRNLDFNNRIKVQGKTIKSIMEKFGHNKIDLLKMDIEGAEFDVLENAIKNAVQIKEICLDHHEHMLKNGRKRIKGLLSMLQEYYNIFYVEKDNKHVAYFGCIQKR